MNDPQKNKETIDGAWKHPTNTLCCPVVNSWGTKHKGLVGGYLAKLSVRKNKEMNGYEPVGGSCWQLNSRRIFSLTRKKRDLAWLERGKNITQK